MKRASVTARFVEFIPDIVEEGVLYISQKYGTIIHKCCCGCGEEVVTPLSPVEWQLKKNKNHVTLHPSIGNWNFRCRSHYWIIKNQIVWAESMSENKIDNIQIRDRLDKERYIDHLNKLQSKPSIKFPVFKKIGSWLCDWWARVFK